MPSAYLADELITAIRDAGMIASADESAQTTRMRAIMNREQRVYLTHLMLSVREAYRVAVVSVPIAAGTLAYRIPSRAIGAKLKLVEVVDASGTAIPLNPIGVGLVLDDALVGGRAGYYLQDNKLVLVSTSTTGTLRIHYYRRMNKIVAETAAAEITAINTTTKVVTIQTGVYAKPSAFVTNATFDLIQGTPHFDLLGFDLAITATDATTLTFTETLPTDLAVGDYIALSGQTPICQAPIELQDVLVQRALVKYLEAQGDPKVAAARDSLVELRANALSLLAPRVEDSPTLIINYDAPGWNRYRGRRR